MAAIALSFDNGPHDVGTPRVLQVLARFGLRASFFVLGRELARPAGLELARRIRLAGHRLGNHSYSHETPLGDDPRPNAVALELEKTEAQLERLGVRERLFRPFGGGGRLGPHLLSPEALAWLQARRYTVVTWSSVPGDWRDAEGWVERALADCAAQPHPLVVLHDAAPEAMLRLEAFVERALAAGHTFTSELPAPCLPLVDGLPRAGLTGLVRTRS